jgi:hypothetical protein
MFANPIEQGSLEADVVAESLRFEPFMAQNLLTFREELLVKAGLLYKVTGGLGLFEG